MNITKVTITPVAFASPPLLTAAGVREPYVLRAVVEVETDAGLTGLGETYGDELHLSALGAAVEAVEGADVYRTEEIYYRVLAAVSPQATPPGVTAVVGEDSMPGEGPGSTAPSWPPGRGSVADRVFSPLEVACLDIQGQAAGRPVSDMIGGPVRGEVRFAAYLSYKWAAHPGGSVAGADEWGPALRPDMIVAQAKTMLDTYGFIGLKLKGGVFPPEEEVEAVRALHDAFPHHPIRLDPNGSWTTDTAITVSRALDGVLEYLEDPVPGLDGMAEVTRGAPGTPLATNTGVTAFEHIPLAFRADAVQVILADHEYWGGLRRTRTLAGICETFGLGLSMRADSQLGIGLAAMVHLASVIPNLSYACDTRWPWKTEDVVNEQFIFENGGLAVSSAPGLGVTLDRDELGRLHEQYLSCGIRKRDDAGYMRRVDPSFEGREARW